MKTIIFTFIKTKASRTELVDFVGKDNEIIEAYWLSGEDSHLLKIEFEQNVHTATKLQEKFQKIPGVESTRSLIVLDVLKTPSGDERTQVSTRPTEPRTPANDTVSNFFRELIDRGRKVVPILSRMRIYQGKHFVSSRSNVPGFRFYLYCGRDFTRPELYIDRGSKAENKKIFDSLYAARERIEAKFGRELKWQRLDDKNACRIGHVLHFGGYANHNDDWPKIQAETISVLGALIEAMEPELERLR